MSLETLLEAARYVELQEAQRLQHSGNQARDESRGPSPLLLTNGSRFHELIVSPDFQKRAAGTREVHNKLEKNRRAHLKECFELLKRQLPPSSEEKKSSNLSILQIALRFIQTLRRKEREFEHEMERLAREKIAHQQRLTVLKKELSAQWEHIDFDKLLPDSHLLHDDPRLRDNISHTTSTASEGDDIMSDHDREEPLSKCGVLYSSTSSLSSAATACSPPQMLNAHPPPIHNNGQSNAGIPLGALTGPTTTTAAVQSTHAPVHTYQANTITVRPNYSKTVSIQTNSVSLPSMTVAGGVQRQSTGVQMGAGLMTGTVLKQAPAMLAKKVDMQATAAPGEPEAGKSLTLPQHHMQLPISAHMVSTTGMAATLVSPTIQLLTPSGIRMLPGDAQPLGLTSTYSYPRVVTVAHRLRDSSDIRTTGSITIPTLQLSNKMVGVQTNGTLRHTKHQPITLSGVPNGLLSSAGMTLTPIGGHNLVTPVTVVSQGNQVAHILASSGKVLKSVTMPSLVNGQYLVKPVTVVVSTASTVPQNSNT